MLELLFGAAIVLLGGYLLLAWTRGPGDGRARRLLTWAKYLVIAAIVLFVLAYIVLAILFTAYSS